MEDLRCSYRPDMEPKSDEADLTFLCEGFAKFQSHYSVKPQCGAEATHTTCDELGNREAPIGAVVCKAHRCRCSVPLTCAKRKVIAVEAAELLPAMRAAWKAEQPKGLSPIPFVAAQQIYSAFAKFGPPHTESCAQDCVLHSWTSSRDQITSTSRSKFVEPRYDDTFFEGVKSMNATCGGANLEDAQDAEALEEAQDAKDAEVANNNLEQENLRLRTRMAEATDIIESYHLLALSEDLDEVVEETKSFLANGLPKVTLPHEAWQIGDAVFGKNSAVVGRPIYEGGKLIGTMEHTWDAMIAVLAVNSWKSNQEIRPTFEWAKKQSELAYARGQKEGAEDTVALETLKQEIQTLRKSSCNAVAEASSLLDIIGAAHEALDHHDYDDPEHTITMHTKDLPDAYRETCKAIGTAMRILTVEDVGGGTLADRGLVRLEAVVKSLRERSLLIQERADGSGENDHFRKVAGSAADLLKDIAEEFEGGVLSK